MGSSDLERVGGRLNICSGKKRACRTGSERTIEVKLQGIAIPCRDHMMPLAVIDRRARTVDVNTSCRPTDPNLPVKIDFAGDAAPIEEDLIAVVA